MKQWYRWLVVFLIIQSCNNVTQSGYIGSLGLKATTIEPKDSIDLEGYGILTPRQIERFGDWFAVSASKTEFNIYLINPQDGQARGDDTKRARARSLTSIASHLMMTMSMHCIQGEK